MPQLGGTAFNPSAFSDCTSLKRAVCNKNLKTIGECAFQDCPKLEDVQLASSSISFSRDPFLGCDRLIELATAAGFPSNDVSLSDKNMMSNWGDGVFPYLIDRFKRSERRRFVLVANRRFNNAVHAHDGTEKEKFAAAQQLLHPASTLSCFACGATSSHLLACSGCKRTRFCNKQCQLDG